MALASTTKRHPTAQQGHINPFFARQKTVLSNHHFHCIHLSNNHNKNIHHCHITTNPSQPTTNSNSK
jgi:hypothetical protein